MTLGFLIAGVHCIKRSCKGTTGIQVFALLSEVLYRLVGLVVKVSVSRNKQTTLGSFVADLLLRQVCDILSSYLLVLILLRG